MNADLRFGRWQDVLADEVCDSLIADPPYGERTHAGHNVLVDRLHGPTSDDESVHGFEAELDYTHWTRDDVHAYVEHWSPRTSVTGTEPPVPSSERQASRHGLRSSIGSTPFLPFHRGTTSAGRATVSATPAPDCPSHAFTGSAAKTTFNVPK